jgi:hypothetical protein
MKRFSAAALFLVAALAAAQFLSPSARADGACTAQQAYDCDSSCFWMAGANCTMVSASCSITGGNSVACACTLYCSHTGGDENDPGGSGYRHFTILPDQDCPECP